MEEKGYKKEDIVYSIIQLSDSNYIVTTDKPNPSKSRYDTHIYTILYITPAGHEFIAATHNKETWGKKISPILQVIGNVSLSIIESVSKGIADAAIDKILLDFQGTSD